MSGLWHRHRVIILNTGSMPYKRTGRKVMQFFPTAVCNVIAWRQSRLRTHWLMGLVGRGWGRSMYSAFPGNCSVSYLSFVYGRSLWAELNGGENSLHWKANMLPLFSIMTLWVSQRLQLAFPFGKAMGPSVPKLSRSVYFI